MPASYVKLEKSVKLIPVPAPRHAFSCSNKAMAALSLGDDRACR